MEGAGGQLPIGQPPPLPPPLPPPPLPPSQSHSQQQPPLVGAVPGGPPQLPPQMFTTATQLLDLTDKKLLVLLRDGRKLIGVLRTWDQYANLVLQSTVERIIVDDTYHDIQRGVYIVRGENVLLLGEIDLDKEDDIPFRHVPNAEIFPKQQAQIAEQKRREKNKKKRLLSLGFEPEQEQMA